MRVMDGRWAGLDKGTQESKALRQVWTPLHPLLLVGM